MISCSLDSILIPFRLRYLLELYKLKALPLTAHICFDRYRCLDLRRQQMKFNLILRHNVVKLIRRYLEDVHGFVEVPSFIIDSITKMVL